MSASTALLFTPADHVRLLHPSRDGGVPLITVSRDGEWGEACIKRDDAEGVAELYEGMQDIYIGQQTMRGHRRVAGLHGLGALYLDLDTRNVPALTSLSPETISAMVLEHAQALDLPAPSLVVFSGRGLAVTWAHGFLPTRALPRWQAVQDALIAAFRGLGADGAVRDAARVLRLVGSVHGRTGETVRALHVGERTCFETMALALLPKTRAEIAEARAAAARRRAERRARQVGKAAAPTVKLTRTTWAETLLSDLLRLHEHRYGQGAVPRGSRDMWHLALSIVAVWLEGMPNAQATVGQLGTLVGRQPDQAIRRKGTVLRRAASAARGTTVEFRGRSRDPRYTPRAGTVMAWLGIDEEEAREAGLRMLISPDLKRERERARWHQRRAAAGGQAREDIQAAAAARAVQAQSLRASGLTWSAVATAMALPSKDCARHLAGRARVTASPPADSNSSGSEGSSATDIGLRGSYGKARTEGAETLAFPAPPPIPTRHPPAEGVVIPFPAGRKPRKPSASIPPADEVPHQPKTASDPRHPQAPQPTTQSRLIQISLAVPTELPPVPWMPGQALRDAMQTALEIAEQVAFDRGVAVRTLQKAFRRTSDALIRQRGVLGEDECDRLMDRLQAWQTLVWDISRAMRKTLPVRKISW